MSAAIACAGMRRRRNIYSSFCRRRSLIMPDRSTSALDSEPPVVRALEYEPDLPEPSSLRQRTLRGSVWTSSEYVANVVLRLGSNLVLARLLVPQMFGIMRIVNIFAQGLQMFSDVGIGPVIIQNPRGDEPAFLNTAWT